MQQQRPSFGSIKSCHIQAFFEFFEKPLRNRNRCSHVHENQILIHPVKVFKILL